MASSVTVHVDGLVELGKALQGLGDEMHLKIARSATRAAAKLVMETAKSLAPVGESGDLKEAIAIRRDTQESKKGFEVVAVGVFRLGKGKGSGKSKTPAYYWKFQEFGTVKMKAHPFLRPAYDEQKGHAVEKMKDSIGRGIQRKVGKSGIIKVK